MFKLYSNTYSTSMLLHSDDVLGGLEVRSSSHGFDFPFFDTKWSEKIVCDLFSGSGIVFGTRSLIQSWVEASSVGFEHLLVRLFSRFRMDFCILLLPA